MQKFTKYRPKLQKASLLTRVVTVHKKNDVYGHNSFMYITLLIKLTPPTHSSLEHDFGKLSRTWVWTWVAFRDVVDNGL